MDSTAKPKTEELEHLFQEQRGSLFNMIARLIGSYDEAHDVLQETFVRAVQGWGQFRGKSEPRTWLYRIAMNCSYSHLKKAQNRPHPVEAEAITARSGKAIQADQALWQQERNRLIEKALHSMKPTLRTVLILRDMEDLSYAEIARIMGWSEGTVASRLSRARRLLGRKLKELGVV